MLSLHILRSVWSHEPADVVNGEKNSIVISVENKSGRNVTLQSVAGSFHHPETNRLVKNVRLPFLQLLCLSHEVI